MTGEKQGVTPQRAATMERQWQAYEQRVHLQNTAALTEAETELLGTGEVSAEYWILLGRLKLPENALLELLSRVPPGRRCTLTEATLLARQGQLKFSGMSFPALQTLSIQAMRAQLLLPTLKAVRSVVDWKGFAKADLGTLATLLSALTIEHASPHWKAALKQTFSTFSASVQPSVRAQRETLLLAYEAMMMSLPPDCWPEVACGMLNLVRPLPQQLLADFALRTGLQDHPQFAQTIRNAADLKRRSAGSAARIAG